MAQGFYLLQAHAQRRQQENKQIFAFFDKHIFQDAGKEKATDTAGTVGKI